MQLSSAFCADQEALQNARAGEASLENVRVLAIKAASAWAKEGAQALKREARKESAAPLIDTDADADIDEAEERAFSENPDRGHSQRFDWEKR